MQERTTNGENLRLSDEGYETLKAQVDNTFLDREQKFYALNFLYEANTNGIAVAFKIYDQDLIGFSFVNGTLIFDGDIAPAHLIERDLERKALREKGIVQDVDVNAEDPLAWLRSGAEVDPSNDEA